MKIHVFSPERQDLKAIATIPVGLVADNIVKNYLCRRDEIFGKGNEISADSYVRHDKLLKDTARTLGISTEEFIDGVCSQISQISQVAMRERDNSPLTNNISPGGGNMRRDICEGYSI